MDAPIASAYTLFIVGTTSLTGSILRCQTKMVDLETCCVFGIPSVIAIFSTRNWIVPALRDLIFQIGSFQFTKRGLILGLFAIMMILASLSLITKKRNLNKVEGQYYIFYMMLFGALAGLLTGLVGAGGGFLIIPAILILTDLHFKETVGTTLMIITINSLLGFLGDVIIYSVKWTFLLLITGLAVPGILTSGKILQKISNNSLRTAFGWFVLCMGILILVKEFY